MISAIRRTHSIPYNAKRDNEFTIPAVAKRFGISRDQVFYWVKKEFLPARKAKKHAPNLIKLDDENIGKINDLLKKEKFRKKKNGVQYE